MSTASYGTNAPNHSAALLATKKGGGRLFEVRAFPEGHDGREHLEQYISSIFNAAYGAQILEYLPLLFGLENGSSRQAALGLRSANCGPLFCEQYLDNTAEQYVEMLYGRDAARIQIMEMGNLVATQAGLSGLLYIIITAAIHEAGIDYLMFAANKRVRNSIARFGFTPRTIHGAEQSRLGDKGFEWGCYYEGEPVVMLADIPRTMEQIKAQPELQNLVDRYQFAIPSLADSIRTHTVAPHG